MEEHEEEDEEMTEEEQPSMEDVLQNLMKHRKKVGTID